MEIESTLKKIGLNDSEIRVYLALLKTGEAKKSEVIKESGIAHSKIYVNLDKLIKKGLAGVVNKNKVNYYVASPVERIKDFLEEKKKEIEKEEKLIDEIIPNLKNLQANALLKTKIEVFTGWKGLESVYSSIINKMKAGQVAYILGASHGENAEQSKNFFHKYGIISRTKKIKTKIIFNEESRKYVDEMEKEAGLKYEKKFLPKTNSVEIVATENYTGIVMLKQEPIVLMIQDKETAEGFILYFNELWKIAKN